MQNHLQQKLTNILLLGAALIACLRLYCLINPFYIPTVDDSAIVMRYLVNFQHGHFFSYNAEDGPVYGISCFWLGLAAGTLSWAGLDPQAALMTVALASTLLFFYAALRVCQFATNNTCVSIILGASVFYAALFIPRTMFLGLETPLHLWLVTEMILAFLKKQARLFYILCTVCIVSKLDTSFMVAFLCLIRLNQAYKSAALGNEIKQALVFFITPLMAWLIIATLIFGNPLPQSFLSKFLYIDSAPKTTWFPFLEPLINSPKNLKGVLFALGSMLLAIVLWGARKAAGEVSGIFAMLCLGTMTLYYVYNPGERMAWYYALPEFLALMSVACLPADVSRSKDLTPASKVLLVAISVGSLFAVVRIRAPMHIPAAKAAPAWQIVYEKERLESGVLANSIAPTERPVLWTGHGYPAYLFHGYVVDYAGLNFRKIWPEVAEARNPSPDSVAFLRGLGLSEADIHSPTTIGYKSGLLLMKKHEPNVYMQHGLFTPDIQKARHMRLAGSFYNMDLMNALALRVFVEDKSWNKQTIAISHTNIEGNPVKGTPQPFKKLRINVPKGASEVMFGVVRGDVPFTVSVKMAEGSTFTCFVPHIDNILQAPEVQACKASFPPTTNDEKFEISTQQGEPIRIFEPTATVDRR